MKAPAWLPYLFIAALLFGAAATYSASAENGKWEYMAVRTLGHGLETIEITEVRPDGTETKTVVRKGDGDWLTVSNKYISERGREGWECFGVESPNNGGFLGSIYHLRRRID